MNSKMIYIFIICSTLFGHFTYAEENSETIQPVQFIDQFDQKNQITEFTKWIIYSSEKDSYELLSDFFKSIKMTKTETFKGFYIADISKMPRLISKYIAIPEMKKLNFSILLDSSGETKNWPRKAKHFTVIQLKSLKIIEIKYFSSKQELESYWPKLIGTEQ